MHDVLHTHTSLSPPRTHTHRNFSPFGIPYLISPSEAEAQCAALDVGGLTQVGGGGGGGGGEAYIII